jgi:hypothetical protein
VKSNHVAKVAEMKISVHSPSHFNPRYLFLCSQKKERPNSTHKFIFNIKTKRKGNLKQV